MNIFVIFQKSSELAGNVKEWPFNADIFIAGNGESSAGKSRSSCMRAIGAMSFVEKMFGSGSLERKSLSAVPGSSGSLTDGALDTLGCVIRGMGQISFPLGDESDPDLFPAICDDFARHIENGASVPELDIQQSPDGSRQWSQVRRFFIDRRTNEKAFVTERLGDYRSVVQKLLEGLRQVGQRDQDTEQAVRENLALIEDAVDSGILPGVKIALNLTRKNIEEKFVQQKEQYEAQISELNERMLTLRQDLVAVQEEMKRDPLTDAFNRRAFDGAIVKSINVHFVLNQPLTMLMIDLDNFKHINDTYGHSAGDQVLKQVGECLARTFIRKNDIVARYGGDEFAVLLADTSGSVAGPLIERFMASMALLRIPGAVDTDRISCSVGYTEIHDSDSTRELVERADIALYEAKAAGRNCFRFTPPPTSAG